MRQGSGADVAGRERDHVPDAALTVTGHRQRLRVLEQVEREAVVSDLLDAAGPRDQAELAGEDVGGTGLGNSRGRYPGSSAGTSAGGLAALLVLRVRVDHLVVGL